MFCECCICHRGCFDVHLAYDDNGHFLENFALYDLYDSCILYKKNNEFMICHTLCLDASNINDIFWNNVIGLKKLILKMLLYKTENFERECSNYIKLIQCDIVDEQKLKKFLRWKKYQPICYICKKLIRQCGRLVCGLSNDDCICVHDDFDCVTQPFIDKIYGFICMQNKYMIKDDFKKELMIREQQARNNLKFYVEHYYCHVCNKIFMQYEQVCVVSYNTHEEVYHNKCMKKNEALIIANQCIKIGVGRFDGSFPLTDQIYSVGYMIQSKYEYDIFLLTHRCRCVCCGDIWYNKLNPAVLLFNDWNTFDFCHRLCMKKIIDIQNKYCGLCEFINNLPIFPLTKEMISTYNKNLLESSMVCSSCGKYIDISRRINACYFENGQYDVMHKSCELKSVAYIGLSKRCYVSNIKEWKNLSLREKASAKANLTRQRKQT